jgi:hypothetical protein
MRSCLPSNDIAASRPAAALLSSDDPHDIRIAPFVRHARSPPLRGRDFMTSGAQIRVVRVQHWQRAHAL